MTIPNRVFIVPYRNRLAQKVEFSRRINSFLADEALTNPYEIYFAHQTDNRPFNRGAMKNIGFLAIKSKYPNHYKTITFIFHDVDTWPSVKGLIDYNTIPGVVKHFYGVTYALGGLFAIKGADFETSQGFPNFWGWGLEDNVINKRCLAAGLTIDRSNFFIMSDPKILRPSDGLTRLVGKRDATVYKYEIPDSIKSISNITYAFHNEYINISQFTCGALHTEQDYYEFDIRRGSKIRTHQGNFRRSWSMKNIM
jgi:hypothetical protein